jgi:hypothetical protein
MSLVLRFIEPRWSSKRYMQSTCDYTTVLQYILLGKYCACLGLFHGIF